MNTRAVTVFQGDVEETEEALLNLAKKGESLIFRMDRSEFQNLMQYVRDPRYIVPSVREGFLRCQALDVFGDNSPAIDLTNLNEEIIGKFMEELFKAHAFVVEETADFKTVELTIQPLFIKHLLIGVERRRELCGGDSTSSTSSEDEIEATDEEQSEHEDEKSDDEVDDEEIKESDDEELREDADEEKAVEEEEGKKKGAVRAPTVYSETDEDDEILIVKPTEEPTLVEEDKPIAPNLGENGASTLTISSSIFAAVSLAALIIL